MCLVLLVIKPVFRVMGFSVTGRVLNSVAGEGLPDATVSLNNQIKGNYSLKVRYNIVLIWIRQTTYFFDSMFSVITKEDGSFRLENMTAGTYTIRVNKELMFFEQITVKIAPNTPQLPDIITAGYEWHLLLWM